MFEDGASVKLELHPPHSSGIRERSPKRSQHTHTHVIISHSHELLSRYDSLARLMMLPWQPLWRNIARLMMNYTYFKGLLFIWELEIEMIPMRNVTTTINPSHFSNSKISDMVSIIISEVTMVTQTGAFQQFLVRSGVLSNIQPGFNHDKCRYIEVLVINSKRSRCYLLKSNLWYYSNCIRYKWLLACPNLIKFSWDQAVYADNVN